ncbi:hypothetical protein ACFSTC_20070 [Nonomuraea ferruginea]
MACTLLLTLGTLAAFPFEMATIADLAGDRLIGTYYGVYNLLSGIGILAKQPAGGRPGRRGPLQRHDSSAVGAAGRRGIGLRGGRQAAGPEGAATGRRPGPGRLTTTAGRGAPGGRPGQREALPPLSRRITGGWAASGVMRSSRPYRAGWGGRDRR